MDFGWGVIALYLMGQADDSYLYAASHIAGIHIMASALRASASIRPVARAAAKAFPAAALIVHVRPVSQQWAAGHAA